MTKPKLKAWIGGKPEVIKVCLSFWVTEKGSGSGDKQWRLVGPMCRSEKAAIAAWNKGPGKGKK